MPVWGHTGERSSTLLLLLRAVLQLALPCSHVTRYLEIGESCPLQLLRTLGRLNESHKASFPDFQDKERCGDMLWEIQGCGVRGPSRSAGSKDQAVTTQQVSSSEPRSGGQMAKLCETGICGPPGSRGATLLKYQLPPSFPKWLYPPCLAIPTCMRFTIISCSTRGCISPVRFMVPSSKMSAWTVGKPVLCSCSECTDSMVGMLRRDTPGQRQGLKRQRGTHH